MAEPGTCAPDPNEEGKINSIAKFARDFDKKRYLDAGYSYYYSSILSSPQTHAANIIGNLTTIGLHGLERTVTGAVSKDAKLLEGAMFYWGAFKAVGDAIKIAGAVFRDDAFSGVLKERASSLEGLKLKNSDEEFFRSKFDFGEATGRIDEGLLPESLQKYNLAKAVVNWVGAAVQIPLSALSAADSGFQTIIRRGELEALGYRTGKQQGLSGEELLRHVSDTVENPSEELFEEAIRQGEYLTFTSPLGEGFSSAIQKGVNHTPLQVGRLVVPFIKTPTNVLKFVNERHPLSYATSRKVREAIAAGGKSRDEALAKIAVGTGIMGLAFSQAQLGAITGSGPERHSEREALRATGWQPYSVKIGDKYFSYHRLDPVGTTAGLAADLAEALSSWDPEDDSLVQGATEAFATVSLALYRNLSSKTYLKGITDFFGMFENTNGDSFATRISKFLAKRVSPLLPASALVGNVGRGLDPELKEAQTVVETLRARIPGLNADLPPRRDVYGDPIRLEGATAGLAGWPIYQSSHKPHPVKDEVVRLGMGFSKPPKQFRIGDDVVKLTTQEYDRLQVLAKGDNDYLDESRLGVLQDLIEDPSYEDLNDDQKEDLIKSVNNEFKKAAKEALIQETPRLLELYEQLEEGP